MRRIWIVSLLLASAHAEVAHAEVVDSVVAAVGTTAIKHSDVLREIRMAAFLNRQTPDFSEQSKREAVNRLIDQVVIRQDLESGIDIPDDPAPADALFRQVRSSYPNPEAFAQALSSRGITEEALKKYLQWQATVLRFIQLRFGGGSTEPSPEVNDAFFSWLDQMREDRNIQILEARLR